MKRLIIISIFCATTITGSPECLDNSYHLSQPYDNKEYHPATTDFNGYKTHCQCPCNNVIIARGKCLDCGHYRYPQPWVIVRTEKKTAIK